METDQPTASVLSNVGGEENEVAPVARVHGQIRNQMCVDDLRNLSLLGVKNLVVGRNFNGRVGPADLQSEIDRQGLANKERNVFFFDLAEVGRGAIDLRVPGPQPAKRILAPSQTTPRALVMTRDDGTCISESHPFLRPRELAPRIRNARRSPPFQRDTILAPDATKVRSRPALIPLRCRLIPGAEASDSMRGAHVAQMT